MPPHAQEAVRAPVEIGEAGREYLRSTRLRGIDPEVAYFDPSAPAPDLDTRQEPERPAAREEPDGSTEEKWLIGLIAGGILAAIAYAFLRFGGGLAVSLKDNAVNPGSRRLKGQPNAPAWAEKARHVRGNPAHEGPASGARPDDAEGADDDRGRERHIDAAKLDRARHPAPHPGQAGAARHLAQPGHGKRTRAVRRA
ncbi:hypothetical protein QW131_22185 [Roseibium salinum]|nr:hypothetical protein [Roseibium salinum]